MQTIASNSNGLNNVTVSVVAGSRNSFSEENFGLIGVI
jgi:hypothetical protein